MLTHFLTVEVALQSSHDLLHRAILAELRQHGEPLRWAIVAVDDDRQTAAIEAVVTADEFLILKAAVGTV